MKIININLGKDLKELRIIPISDVHIGDKLTNYKILKEVLETIRDTPNVYTILNGDLCNTALKNSKSDVYSDELSPMEQINRLIEILEPIKDKILVIGSGNHEDRILKETNIDIVRLVVILITYHSLSLISNLLLLLVRQLFLTTYLHYFLLLYLPNLHKLYQVGIYLFLLSF